MENFWRRAPNLVLSFSISLSWLDFFPPRLGPAALAVAPPTGAGGGGSGREGDGPLAPRLVGRVAETVGPPGALLPRFTGAGALGAVPMGGCGGLGVPTGPPGARDMVVEVGLTLACGATAASWSATVGVERSIPGGGRSRGVPGRPMGGGGPGKLF